MLSAGTRDPALLVDSARYTHYLEVHPERRLLLERRILQDDWRLRHGKRRQPCWRSWAAFSNPCLATSGSWEAAIGWSLGRVVGNPPNWRKRFWKSL